MKTQIMQLEAHDDFISTRDKIGWSQAGRVLLVWPERGHVLTRRLDLVLLQRHCRQLGTQLALVTMDAEVRFHASQLGIPYYKSVRQAQRKHWRTERQARLAARDRAHLRQPYPPRRKPRPLAYLRELHQLAHPQPPAWIRAPITRLGFFSLGVLAILAISALLIPGAEISLTPSKRVQELDLLVRANPEQEEINLAGILPAGPVYALVEGQASAPTHGVIRVPEQMATVGLQFTNLTDQAVFIPAGSIVSPQPPAEGDSTGPPIRFATLQSGSLPAGPGKTVKIPARAIEGGSSSNLPAGSLVFLEGPLAAHVTVTNPEAASGGSDRDVSAPSIYDREKLFNQLRANLEQEALSLIGQQISPTDLTLTSTLTVTRVISQTFDPPDKQPADELKLSLRLEFKALKVSTDDLRALATTLLDTNLPQGYLPVADSLRIENLGPETPGADGLPRWRLHASRQLQASISSTGVSSLALGRSPEQAQTRLKAALPLEEEPVIRLWPEWWPRLPILPLRVKVISN